MLRRNGRDPLDRCGAEVGNPACKLLDWAPCRFSPSAPPFYPTVTCRPRLTSSGGLHPDKPHPVRPSAPHARLLSLDSILMRDTTAMSGDAGVPLKGEHRPGNRPCFVRTKSQPSSAIRLNPTIPQDCIMSLPPNHCVARLLPSIRKAF